MCHAMCISCLVKAGIAFHLVLTARLRCGSAWPLLAGDERCILIASPMLRAITQLFLVLLVAVVILRKEQRHAACH